MKREKDPRRGLSNRGVEYSGTAGLTNEELGAALRAAARRGQAFVLAVFGYDVRASLEVSGFYCRRTGNSLFEAHCPDYPTLDRAVAALALGQPCDVGPYTDGFSVEDNWSLDCTEQDRKDRIFNRAWEIAEAEEDSILSNLFSHRRAPAPDVGTDDKEAKQ